MFLNAYAPPPGSHRMGAMHDPDAARRRYYDAPLPNLRRLLRRRYEWMNPYLKGKERVVELGAGAGLSKEFLDHDGVMLTDCEPRPWIDEVVDALDPPYPENSLDAVILTQTLHHVAHPPLFLRRISRCLRPGGVLLIQELHTSLLLRLVMRGMRHEGWDYGVDVFNDEAVANAPSDPWSANIAIPELLFSDVKRFEREFPDLRVVRNELNECILWLLSGGVGSKTFTIPLPESALDLVEAVDSLLVRLAPSLFALGGRTVLERQAARTRPASEVGIGGDPRPSRFPRCFPA